MLPRTRDSNESIGTALKAVAEQAEDENMPGVINKVGSKGPKMRNKVPLQMLSVDTGIKGMMRREANTSKLLEQSLQRQRRRSKGGDSNFGGMADNINRSLPKI